MPANYSSSPAYANQDWLVDSSGNLQIAIDDTSFEVLQRLYTIRGTQVFDFAFGSKILDIINSRGVTNNQIVLEIQQTLAPMIQQQKISSDITVFPKITNFKVSLEIYLSSPSGKQFPVIFASFLIN